MTFLRKISITLNIFHNLVLFYGNHHFISSTLLQHRIVLFLHLLHHKPIFIIYRSLFDTCHSIIIKAQPSVYFVSIKRSSKSCLICSERRRVMCSFQCSALTLFSVTVRIKFQLKHQQENVIILCFFPRRRLLIISLAVQE